jgi:hypothetical protein
VSRGRPSRWRAPRFRPEPERPLPGLADPGHPRPWRAPQDGGYHPDVSVPEPTVGPGPSGSSSAARSRDGNVHRPHPAANAWPDDAVTVTYAELRRLVALHLELCSATMPRDKPWDWMRMRAGAVRDGEAPLLLSEVMDR